MGAKKQISEAVRAIRGLARKYGMAALNEATIYRLWEELAGYQPESEFARFYFQCTGRESRQVAREVMCTYRRDDWTVTVTARLMDGSEYCFKANENA